MEQGGEGFSLGIMDGGAVLAPFLAGLVLLVALPVSLGAFGLVLGDAARGAAGTRLGKWTGIVLSAAPFGLLGPLAIWMTLSDGNVSGLLALVAIFVPILFGFLAAVLSGNKVIRFCAIAFGFLEGAAIALYYYLTHASAA